MNKHKTLFEVFTASILLSIGWHSINSYDNISFIQYAQFALGIYVILYAAYNTLKRKWTWRFPSEHSIKQHIYAGLSALNLLLFPLLISWSVRTGITTLDWTESGYTALKLGQFGLNLLLLVCLLFTSARNIRLSVHLPIAVASSLFLYEFSLAQRLPTIEQSVVIPSPVNEAFLVLNGGNSRFQNVHADRTPPRYLIALTTSPNQFGEPEQTNDVNRRHFSHGKTVYAPVDATVYEATDVHLDHPLGQPDLVHRLGNYIILEISTDRYLIFTNLKQHSFKVKAGETVRRGQAIAQIGHSGVITECALMFCAIDSPNVFDPNTKSYPIYFENVTNLNQPKSGGPFYPIRNDRYQPNNILGQ